MQISDIQVGKPLEIFVEREGYNYRVVSKVEEVKDNTVFITLIESRVRVFQFKENDIIDIVYRNDNRMWKWRKVSAGITQLDGSSVHYFYSTEPGETYNRRNAYRVSIGEKLVIKYITKKSEKVEDEVNSKLVEDSLQRQNSPNSSDTLNEEIKIQWLSCEAYIRDISEVGAGFFTNEKFEIGDIIRFELSTNFGTISCQGEIARCSDNVHGVYRNYYGCSYTETSKNLIRYIFEVQKIQLKKAKEKEYKR